MAGQDSVSDDEFVLVDVDGNRVSVECSSAPMVRGERVVGVFGQIKREREALGVHSRLEAVAVARLRSGA